MLKITKAQCYLFIIVVSFIAFFNTLSNEFVYDDTTIIVKNEKILSISNIPNYFTAQGEYRYSFGKLYRPIIMVSFALDNSLWNMKPSGFHFTNLLLHTLASLFLFKILLLLFGKYEYGLISSLIASAVFAVHPIHTEAVSFISSRTDIIMTLFFFISFYCFIKYRHSIELLNTQKNKGDIKSEKTKSEKLKSSNKLLVLSFVFYFLGFLSKEMIIVLPVIFLLFDILYFKRTFKDLLKDIKIYSVYVIITIVCLLIRYYVTRNYEEKLIYDWFYGKDFITVFATMIKAVPEYVRLLIIPINLSYNYNGIIGYSYSLLELPVILSTLFFIALVVLSVYFYKKYPVFSFSILFFFIGLSPVSNIIPTGNVMAERYLYFVSFALCLSIAFYLSKTLTYKNFKTVTTIFVLILIVFTFLTINRNYDWKSNDALWMSGEGKESAPALINVAGVYMKKNQLEKAENLYKRALDINPNMINAHQNLGILNMMNKKYDIAETEFRKAQQIDSTFPNSYYLLAKLKIETNKTEEAIAELEKMEKKNLIYKDSKKMLEYLKQNKKPEDTSKISIP